MIIPTLIVFILIGYSFLSTQINSIKAQGPAVLDSLEESVEASIYNTGYQLDSTLSNFSFALSMKNVLNRIPMEQKERYFYDMIKNLFTTYELVYPYIHSVYLYLDGIERFMTSASGQIANVNTYYDTEWLDEYKKMNEEDKIYTSRRWIQRNSYDEPVEVISLFYRNTYLKGVIVININKNQYGRVLRNLVISDQQKVLLINAKGDVICSTDQSLEEISLANQLVEKANPSTIKETMNKINNTWIDVGNDKYFVYIQHSDYLDIYQVSAISRYYLFSEIRYYLILVAIVLLLDIVIILCLAYFYTKRSFYYIRECISVFSAAERGEEIKKNVDVVKDEYGLILNNIIFMYLKNNKMQLELMEKQHQYEITEMTALQLQINPHFIFNTLQIIDIEIVRNIGIKSTSHKMVQELSKVVKYALTNPTEEVTLREELDYLKAYLEIQRIRFQNSVITYFEVDDTVLENTVFRLLLQPMLENCFVHGMKGHKGHLMIKLKIYRHEEAIHFTVVDNGVGISEDELSELKRRIGDFKSKNIGLTNVNHRLILHYGPESSLTIRSRRNIGTVVRFMIPIREKSPDLEPQGIIKRINDKI